MKCKNCGGELIFQNGMGLCESCKNTYRLDYGFENTEVYICYTESDAQGRRTKDSIIAEELYQKLESSNHVGRDAAAKRRFAEAMAQIAR